IEHGTYGRMIDVTAQRASATSRGRTDASGPSRWLIPRAVSRLRADAFRGLSAVACGRSSGATCLRPSDPAQRAARPALARRLVGVMAPRNPRTDRDRRETDRPEV